MSRRPRLSRSRDFDAVYRRGKSAASRTLVVYAFRHKKSDVDEIPEGVRLGLAVPRSVGNAVVRNKVKRKLREAFAYVVDELEPEYDVVVGARPGVAEVFERENHLWLVQELRSLLSQTVLSSEKIA